MMIAASDTDNIYTGECADKSWLDNILAVAPQPQLAVLCLSPGKKSTWRSYKILKSFEKV